MNEQNTIPGFYPRLMGSFTGLMLLSSVLTLLPAEPISEEAPTRANAVEFQLVQKGDRAQSLGELSYFTEKGNKQTAHLGVLLNPNLGVKAAIGPVVTGVFHSLLDGDMNYAHSVLPKLKHFRAAFQAEAKNEGPHQAKFQAAEQQFGVLISRAEMKFKHAGLGICGPDYLTGQKKCPI